MNQVNTIDFPQIKPQLDGKQPARAFKVLLYSHDSWGLGHFRRNLAIATALTKRFAKVNVLLVSGSPCATRFSMSERCDVIKLPAIGKDSSGRYVPKYLGLTLDETLEMRRQLLLTTYENLKPDVVIIDHQVSGLLGEARVMLQAARTDGAVTIFGMRDIVDSVASVQKAWSSTDSQDALAFDYDRICVYGDAKTFDPVAEYPVLQAHRHKIEMMGYISRPVDQVSPGPEPRAQKQVLVTVGGGEDGYERVEAYIDAVALSPANWTSHIITGPLMDESNVRACKKQVKRLGLGDSVHISRFHSNIPALIQQSAAVVSMAGYNSCTEILRSGKPAVLFPRTQFRHEQRMRAERLTAQGLVQAVYDLDPVALRLAVETALSARSFAGTLPKLDGLNNLCDLIDSLSGDRRPTVTFLAQARGAYSPA